MIARALNVHSLNSRHPQMCTRPARGLSLPPVQSSAQPAMEAVMDALVLIPVLLALTTPAHLSHQAPRDPLAHTFSIVARDPATGEMGVAVQSHYFSVGPVVPWAEAGVGAVATQSLVLIDYGPNGLALMKQGMTANEALDSLVKADAHNEGRQVAMVDAKGNVAAYTGKNAIPFCGHRTGHQFSCQANLMASDRVWPAMAEAYEKAQGDLAERMMQALEAGQKAGGDIRGMQSAAILIVKAQSTGKPWNDVVMNLRVEDSPQPLRELRRLMKLRRAYDLEDQGDNFISEKKTAEALKAYEEASKLAPEVVELKFWAAISMYTNGREAEA
ncbi:MAG TPA: DUF1028 domain-containing protein, partial [Candidatus Udaeobacter sp.]|nr:DUF1028 domain-containing protein [Candidatus Udaeobacter sp.]